MARDKNPEYELYDTILFYLWDVTTGQSGSKAQVYKGAKCFARFLISELDRREVLEKNGETQIQSRGLAIPNFLVNCWTYNILEDCNEYRITPPIELCEVIYRQLKCTHETRRDDDTTMAKIKAQKLRAANPNLSIREIAREVGVAHTTVMRWQNIDEENFDSARYREIRRLSHEETYAPAQR